MEAEIALASENFIADLKRCCKILRELNTGTSCYHGAGHAFFQKTRDVFKALKQCDYLKEEGSDLQNCYTGVFSEYGNQALGFDGDTGLAIKGEPRIRLDLDNPYQFCTGVDEQYKNACYTQLTKIFIKPVDPIGSLEKCLQNVFEERVQTTCMRIVSGVLARNIYSSQEVVKPPPIILSSTPLLRKAYIEGVHEGFMSFRSSGIQKDWKKECELFPLGVDVVYCLSLK